jgi:hypothetical protein
MAACPRVMLACERWTLTHNSGCAVASALALGLTVPVGLAVPVGLVLPVGLAVPVGLVLLGLEVGLAAI